jgi:hypothetical protein
MKIWSIALLLTVVVPASAHHPFTPYYDGSKLEALTGTVAELHIINPHVLLIVDVTSPARRKGRWVFEGFAPNYFSRSGVNLKTRLPPGTAIVISGWPAKAATARAFSGREVTFADKSTLPFGPTPEEGDRWQCAGPCAYSYPEPPPN